MNLTIKELLEELITIPEYENYFDKDPDTVKGLTEDILGAGRVIIPLIVNERPNGDLVLLDGHTRLSICKRHIDILGETNIDIEYKQFATPLEEELFIVKFQCNRRNLPKTNDFKLKIGKLATKIASYSKMNNQYATWVNDPAFQLDEDDNTYTYIPKSDEGEFAPTNSVVNLDTLSKETNISKRTIKEHSQAYRGLAKLAKAYAPSTIAEAPDLESFSSLFSRKQLSAGLIKEMVRVIDNPLFDSKLQALLRKAVDDSTLDIKSKWETIKSNIAKPPTTKKKPPIVEEEKEDVFTTTSIEDSLSFFGDITESDVKQELATLNKLIKKVTKVKAVDKDGAPSSVALCLYNITPTIHSYLSSEVINTIEGIQS